MSDLISRADAIEAVKQRLYQSAMNNMSTIMTADKIFADIADNRIELWLNEVPSADTVSREDYEEVEAYMDTLVDAFIEDGEELAESVNVVRCKDCVHWKADNEVFELGFCCVFPQKWVAETFYCADGERREP